LILSKLAPPSATLFLFQTLQYQATRQQRHKLQKKSDEPGKDHFLPGSAYSSIKLCCGAPILKSAKKTAPVGGKIPGGKTGDKLGIMNTPLNQGMIKKLFRTVSRTSHSP
jgi:hypothetical protein